MWGGIGGVPSLPRSVSLSTYSVLFSDSVCPGPREDCAAGVHEKKMRVGTDYREVVLRRWGDGITMPQSLWLCHVLRRTFASGLVGGLFDAHCGSETVRVEYRVYPS